MKQSASRFSLVVTLAAGTIILATPSIQGQEQGQGFGPPSWVQEVRHDTSRPLREIEPKPGRSTREDFEVKEDNAPPLPAAADAALQSIVVAPLAASPGVGFDGVGEGNSQFTYDVTLSPPDTTGDVSPTQYVQWVNPSFAIFDKATGNKLYGPAGGNTLWADFGGPCETRNDGDPMVQYDQLADRWVMTQFALQSGNYQQCVAVSQTSDATGAWHRYAFPFAEFPDYPKLAVWPDAYYITFNMFGPAGASFTGGQVCAWDRARMLNGLSATQICKTVPYSSLLASDLEGKTLPPAGRPNYVMSLNSSTTLNLWRFTPNFTNGTAVFTGPSAVTVSAYTPACNKNCVPQPGTPQLLDVLGGRLMYRLSYRNLGTREALLVNHSVVAGTAIGVRWYEINITNDSPSIRQQSTYAPADLQYRWMGSVAMDKIGNIALGYSIGSLTQRPSIRFAGRETTDPLNNLSTDNSMQDGTGSQQVSLSRWGDYSTMTVDPADDCTFWYTTEYLKTDGTWNWSTRIGSFKFTSCNSTAPTPTFTLGATPASRTITQGQSTSFTATVSPENSYTGSGTFSVTGLPSGAIGTFAPAEFSPGNNSTTLSITNTAGATPGSYPLVITAADAGAGITKTANVTLVVNAPVTQDFSLTANPGTLVLKRGKSGTYSVAVTQSGGFAETVNFSVTGLPGSTTATFSPASVNGSGNVTLSIGTNNPATPKGTFTLTITATSASKVHSVTVSLKVQ